MSDEGVYTVEMADSTGPGQCEPGTYYVEGGGGAGCTTQAKYGWSQTDEVPGWQDFSDEIDWQTDVSPASRAGLLKPRGAAGARADEKEVTAVYCRPFCEPWAGNRLARFKQPLPTVGP